MHAAPPGPNPAAPSAAPSSPTAGSNSSRRAQPQPGQAATRGAAAPPVVSPRGSDSATSKLLDGSPALSASPAAEAAAKQSDPTLAAVSVYGDREDSPIWPRGTITAVVLGGGESDSRRLFPLTQQRTLPALPFGGAYRLIDILMSNLLNSGINKIHILTAYNSYSLNRHLQRTYDMSGGVPYGGDGFIEVVAASQSPDNMLPASGTAACVRQFMSYFNTNPKNRFIEDLLILPGDHVYTADLTPVVQYHRNSGADLTIVCRPVSGKQAQQLGVVKLDPHGGCRISAFAEKPPADALAEFTMSDDELAPFLAQSQREQQQRERERRRREARQRQRRGQHLGEAAEAAAEAAGPAGGMGINLDTMGSMDTDALPPGSVGYVGSTGIYIFRRSVLADVLQRHNRANDFGRQLIPEIIKEGYKVQAYRMPGYWADVGGCVGDFFDANMALLDSPPSLSFNAPQESPFFRYPRTVPATQMYGTRVSRSLVSAGCILRDSRIQKSVIGMRSIIGPNVTVQDSVVMGASYYEHEKPAVRPTGPLYPAMGIGSGSLVRKAILDLNTRVGANVQLVNKEGVFESTDRSSAGIYIRDGIIITARDTVVPDGTVV